MRLEKGKKVAVGRQRLSLLDAQDFAVRSHAVLGVVGSSGCEDNPFQVAFG